MQAPNVPKRVRNSAQPEFFAGRIGDRRASKLEERFARELSRLNIDFIFQLRISPMLGVTLRKTNLAGEVEVDFVADWQGLMKPIQIDGEIAHFKTAAQSDIDKQKDDIVNAALKPFGAWPILRVPYWKVWTPEQTRQTVMEIFI